MANKILTRAEELAASAHCLELARQEVADRLRFDREAFDPDNSRKWLEPDDRTSPESPESRSAAGGSDPASEEQD